MKKRIAALVAIGSLVFTAGASALTKTGAEQVMKMYVQRKAACGQGFWICSNYQLLSLSSHSNGDWSGESDIWRGHGYLVQACLVTATMTSAGTVITDTISCHDVST